MLQKYANVLLAYLRKQHFQSPFVSVAMKKTAFVFLVLVLLFACNSKKGVPDVSGIKVEIPVERFDKDFFSIDTNNIPASLQKLWLAHPDFHTDFMQQVLGVPGPDSSVRTILVVKEFLRGYSGINAMLQKEYSNTNWLQKDLEKAFRFVKYYFPKYKTGKAVLFTGPFDAPGVATTNFGIAVGLQQFAGKDFEAYKAAAFQEMFPSYISRRFSKEYITANCMKAVVQDIFPDNSRALPLIEQMIEKGKQWYLLDKFLPTTADSVKTGYTQQQLDWCKENEGLIWSYIVKNEDLNSLNPEVIQTYIGEGPFTQGLSQELSPGNIGQWIGWQIVKKYVNKNSDFTPEQVMTTPAREILEKAKYKPK
jgi:hypothetical protein